jgi:hypothetical protein
MKKKKKAWSYYFLAAVRMFPKWIKKKYVIENQSYQKENLLLIPDERDTIKI